MNRDGFRKISAALEQSAPENGGVMPYIGEDNDADVRYLSVATERMFSPSLILNILNNNGLMQGRDNDTSESQSPSLVYLGAYQSVKPSGGPTELILTFEDINAK